MTKQTSTILSHVVVSELCIPTIVETPFCLLVIVGPSRSEILPGVAFRITLLFSLLESRNGLMLQVWDAQQHPSRHCTV